MTTILPIVLPIFALVALGFYAGRRRGFTKEMAQGLSRYLSLYALPALLFVSIARTEIPRPIEWGFLASFYLAAVAIFALGIVWRRASREYQDTIPVGLASSFSNIAQIGLPVIMEACGPSVGVPLTLLIAFQSPLLFTLATTLVESQRTAGRQVLSAVATAVKATATSPLVASVMLGFAVNMFGVPLPSVLDKSLDLLSRTVLPCACFSLGTTLAFIRSYGGIGQAAVMAGFKTVLHPLFTWVLAAKVFMLPPEWIVPAVTAAALPIGINAYSFAERYEIGRELVSMSLLMSTLISPITISLAFMAATA